MYYLDKPQLFSSGFWIIPRVLLFLYCIILAQVYAMTNIEVKRLYTEDNKGQIHYSFEEKNVRKEIKQLIPDQDPDSAEKPNKNQNQQEEKGNEKEQEEEEQQKKTTKKVRFTKLFKKQTLDLQFIATEDIKMDCEELEKSYQELAKTKSKFIYKFLEASKYEWKEEMCLDDPQEDNKHKKQQKVDEIICQLNEFNENADMLFYQEFRYKEWLNGTEEEAVVFKWKSIIDKFLKMQKQAQDKLSNYQHTIIKGNWYLFVYTIIIIILFYLHVINGKISELDDLHWFEFGSQCFILVFSYQVSYYFIQTIFHVIDEGILHLMEKYDMIQQLTQLLIGEEDRMANFLDPQSIHCLGVLRKLIFFNNQSIIERCNGLISTLFFGVFCLIAWIILVFDLNEDKLTVCGIEFYQSILFTLLIAFPYLIWWLFIIFIYLYLSARINGSFLQLQHSYSRLKAFVNTLEIYQDKADHIVDQVRLDLITMQEREDKQNKLFENEDYKTQSISKEIKNLLKRSRKIGKGKGQREFMKIGIDKLIKKLIAQHHRVRQHSNDQDREKLLCQSDEEMCHHQNKIKQLKMLKRVLTTYSQEQMFFQAKKGAGLGIETKEKNALTFNMGRRFKKPIKTHRARKSHQNSQKLGGKFPVSESKYDMTQQTRKSLFTKENSRILTSPFNQVQLGCINYLKKLHSREVDSSNEEEQQEFDEQNHNDMRYVEKRNKHLRACKEHLDFQIDQLKIDYSSKKGLLKFLAIPITMAEFSKLVSVMGTIFLTLITFIISRNSQSLIIQTILQQGGIELDSPSGEDKNDL